MTKNPEQTRYGRCQATAKSTGKQCGRAAVGEHGKCDKHGGKSLKGEDHPNFKHGAWSKYADYDEDILESVDDVEDDLEVLQELRDERLAQYYTVLQYMAQNEGVPVAQQILEKIDAGQEVNANLISQLARVLQVSSRSMDDLIARIQSLTNDIADRKGEDPRTFREEKRLDDDQFEQLAADIKSAYGGSDS